jgi:hypothetical protein
MSGENTNLFAINCCGNLFDAGWCCIAGNRHRFEWPEEAKAIPWWQYDYRRRIYGCGLLIDPEDNLSIFFTKNGTLLGQLIFS